MVEVRLGGAMSVMGVPANVHKQLRARCAHYNATEGRLVEYRFDDGHGGESTLERGKDGDVDDRSKYHLYVKGYFETKMAAELFIRDFDCWRSGPAASGGLKILSITDVPQLLSSAPRNLKPFEPVEEVYQPDDYKWSPLRDLAGLASAASSLPSKTPATDELMKFQSLEDYTRRGVLKYFKMHIKAAKHRGVTHDSNFIAGSWPFHQAFDGMQTEDNIPMLKVTYESTVQHRDQNGRFRVTVVIEFYNTTAREQFAPYLKPGSRVVDGHELRFRSFIDVERPDITEESLKFKANLTQQAWDDHEAFLERM